MYHNTNQDSGVQYSDKKTTVWKIRISWFQLSICGKWGKLACKLAKNYGYKYFGLSKCVNERCGNSRFNS